MSLLDDDLKYELDDLLIPINRIEQYLKIHSFYDDLNSHPNDILFKKISKPITYWRLATEWTEPSGKIPLTIDKINMRYYYLTLRCGKSYIHFNQFINKGINILYLITNDMKYEVPNWLVLMVQRSNCNLAILYGEKFKSI